MRFPPLGRVQPQLFEKLTRFQYQCYASFCGFALPENVMKIGQNFVEYIFSQQIGVNDPNTWSVTVKFLHIIKIIIIIIS